MDYKVLLIEDEPFAQKELKRLIKEGGYDFDIIVCLDSVEESVKWLSKNTPDLIFMDIQLSDGLSFEIFEKTQVKSPVIFTTAFDEYAIKAFKVNGLDYLLKPIDEDELQNAIQKFTNQKKQETDPTLKPGFLADEQLQQLLSLYRPTNYKTRFVAKIGENMIHIATEDIPYFYFEEKVVFLVTKDNHRYIVEYTLDQLERLLDPRKFFRINRKYIASIGSIEKISRYFNSRLKIKLKPHIDDEILISRAKVKDFLSWLDG